MDEGGLVKLDSTTSAEQLHFSCGHSGVHDYNRHYEVEASSEH
jgi:hypothetical protein